MKVDILGTEYDVEHRSPDTDQYLATHRVAGYTDQSIKSIVIRQPKRDAESVADMEAFRKEVGRHEIVHAFLFESGLDGECSWHTEEAVDWMAKQMPKIVAACKAAGVWD